MNGNLLDDISFSVVYPLYYGIRARNPMVLAMG